MNDKTRSPSQDKKLKLGYQLFLKGKKAEEFVQDLARKTFLEDWCYDNPKLPNGKEICDLLIVYDEVAIIWQIKDLKLDEKGKYKENEVKKNISQIHTARNRLFKKNLQIELINPRRGKELFDATKIKEIFLISALLGKGEDFFQFSIQEKGHIIHTFTREFTEIILKELDTIRDFIDYLRKKEEDIIKTNKGMFITGEEKELLAYYLMNERSFQTFKDANMIIITDGLWDELQKKPEYLSKKKEDEISYGWDEIINTAHTSGEAYEVVAKELARPTRFERRILSKAFFDAHLKAQSLTAENCFRRAIQLGGTTYCFLFYDDVEPREIRRAMLGQVCFIARGMYPQNAKVIGIATEMKIEPFCSYDFCLVDYPEWTEQIQKEMEKIQQETGIFTNFRQIRVQEDEYPPV